MHRFGTKRIAHAIGWRYQHAKNLVSSVLFSILAALEVRVRFAIRGKAPRHCLPGELIVSLTSYPPRFATLLPTLKCLLAQSIAPDRVILWIDDDSLPLLPKAVQGLCGKGLEIRTCKDLGPYKKIIPALRLFPDAFIVTADDDIHYYRHWLRELIHNWSGDKTQIVCHRAHKIKFQTETMPAPYNKWQFDIKGPARAKDIFPTGVGGVFYPPGSLSDEAVDEEAFLSLSSRADDVWLYWMGRRAGATYQKTSGRMKLVLWRGSQKTALVNENLGASANDAQIVAMVEHYGWPV